MPGERTSDRMDAPLRNACSTRSTRFLQFGHYGNPQLPPEPIGLCKADAHRAVCAFHVENGRILKPLLTRGHLRCFFANEPLPGGTFGAVTTLTRSRSLRASSSGMTFDARLRRGMLRLSAFEHRQYIS